MKEFDFLNRDQDPVDKMYIVVLSRTVKIRTGVFLGGGGYFAFLDPQ